MSCLSHTSTGAARRSPAAATIGRRRVGLPRRRLLAPALLLSWLAGCGPTSFLITPVSADRHLTEKIVRRESVWTSDRIALIDVDGLLTTDTGAALFGLPRENPVARFKEKLDLAANDDRVRAVVLRINSPGGGVTASDLMYQELLRFRERSRKPVIAVMVDVGASGAYYLACAADRIWAHPTTVTGSIGVIMILPEVTGTMQKLGIRTNVFKSGDMKDAGSPFHAMSDRERAYFQHIIDEMYERFLSVVRKARGSVPEHELRELADGRVFVSKEAKAAGLIDDVGTIEDAIHAAKAAAGMADRKFVIVQYARPTDYRPNIYAQPGGAGTAQVNLVNIDLPAWLRGESPRFMYLWAPGW